MCYNIGQEIPEGSRGTNEFSYESVLKKLGKKHTGLNTELFVISLQT